MKTAIPVLVLAFLAGCAAAPGRPTAAATAPPPPARANPACPGDYMPPWGTLHATAWMQQAAEYRALAATTYRQALPALARNLADPALSADAPHPAPDASLPPALVLDLDETVLDNSGFQARWYASGHCLPEFEREWDAWVSEAKAAAVPGALGFLAAARQMRDAQGRPLRIVFITNRECRLRPGSADPCPQKQETVANLRALGLDWPGIADDTLLKSERPEWTSEKQSRRDFVARRHRIVMLVGDDFGDFLQGARSSSLAEREAARCRYAHWWGERWVLLPNPVYGSWQVRLAQSGQPPLDPAPAVAGIECPAR